MQFNSQRARQYRLIMVALWNRADHYIFIPWFLLLLSFFFSFLAQSQPSQIGCLPCFHTWCGLSANLRCRCETFCTRLTANTGCKEVAKKPSGQHRTTLLAYIFATKACIDNCKKPVKQQYLLDMSSQYGELRPTSGWDRFASLGHPCKFQRVSRLGSVTARHLVVGVSQTLQRWTEGATYIRQGGYHVGHWITFLVAKIWPDKFVRWCPDGDFWRLFCVLCFQRAACSRFQTCILNSH